jgi:hypothetical protein
VLHLVQEAACPKHLLPLYCCGTCEAQCSLQLVHNCWVAEGIRRQQCRDWPPCVVALAAATGLCPDGPSPAAASCCSPVLPIQLPATSDDLQQHTATTRHNTSVATWSRLSGLSQGDYAHCLTTFLAVEHDLPNEQCGN